MEKFHGSATSCFHRQRRFASRSDRGGDRDISVAEWAGVHCRRPTRQRDQVRQKLQSEGYSNIQVVRQGGYFEATASKDGQTGRILVDSQTGRLAGEREEDDD